MTLLAEIKAFTMSQSLNYSKITVILKCDISITNLSMLADGNRKQIAASYCSHSISSHMLSSTETEDVKSGQIWKSQLSPFSYCNHNDSFKSET